MAARSIANGAYLTLMYVQSGSRPADWYRVALDRRTRAISCDCPIWTFDRHGDRTCKHTEFVRDLLVDLLPPGARPAPRTAPTASAPAPTPAAAAATRAGAATGHPSDEHPYVHAINTQFPGFLGHWSVDERRGSLAGARYRVVQIGFQSGNGDAVEATLAFADGHAVSPQDLLGEVAVRAGYCIALELAHRHGIDLDVRPPAHYTARSTGGRGTGPARGTGRRGFVPPARSERELPSIQLDQILRVAGVPAEGRTPAERAEGTLRLLLGDETYAQLLTNGYLDVPSVRYAERQRVYRLRRDPQRNDDKRVRVFEQVGGQMAYVKDFCIVRASYAVPEADHFVTKWLGLLSDEDSIIGVVGPHNIFSPHSDDWSRRIEEAVPPIWYAPRAAVVA